MGTTFERWAMRAEAVSVPLARRRVTTLMRAEGWDDQRLDEIALLTTELVTNAVEHARTPFTVTVDLTGQRLRVEIRDGCATRPIAVHAPSETAIGGRGLTIVAALADRWGVQQDSAGKSVWFEAQRADVSELPTSTSGLGTRPVLITSRNED